jgi:DNA-directed RNA polymerase subunit RPC12/RpoP
MNNLPVGFSLIPGFPHYAINRAGHVLNVLTGANLKPFMDHGLWVYKVERDKEWKLKSIKVLYAKTYLQKMPDPVWNRLVKNYEAQYDRSYREGAGTDYALMEADSLSVKSEYSSFQTPYGTRCQYCGEVAEDGACPLCGVKIHYQHFSQGEWGE